MIFVTLLLVWIAINVTPRAPASENMNISDSSRTLSLSTQTVGSETEAFATFASWPGEIISPNDAEVQPPREGTIISWDVTIGEYVKAGQILGRLSAAPLTPELAKTLADQTESLTRARANASSTQFFVTQTKEQLGTFTTTDAATLAIEQAKLSAKSAGENIRSTLRQVIAQEFSEFSQSGDDAFSLSKQNRIYSVVLKKNFGVLNSQLRDQYVTSLDTALKSLELADTPEQEGRQYFLDTVRLVSASIADESYSQSKLDELKKTIAEHQSEFNVSVETYRAAVLDVSEKQKEYAERTRDTTNKISELDRDRASTMIELETAEASYRAVASAISGGAVIIAPKNGYISSLQKQVGEFASPGEPIASISSAAQTDKIVRFRIPSNAEVPKRGEAIRVVRPGFAKDVQGAIIIGVGTALDGNGSFMADARFEKAVAWPAHLSVRVIPASRSTQTIAVPFDAVFWDEENHPHVWLVDKEGTVASRAVRTGRTFGDAVEILDGLALGDTYVSLASDSIKEGMRIEETVIAVEPSAPEGDGHGHAHDE
jgi:multidrug efflux pump subunit AcrA (membrane-fusion protein)